MREAEPSVLNGLVRLQGKGVGQSLATAYPDIISDIRITEINYFRYPIISYRIYQDSRDDITLAYQDRQVWGASSSGGSIAAKIVGELLVWFFITVR